MEKIRQYYVDLSLKAENIVRISIKFLSLTGLIFSAQLCGQEIAPGISQVSKTKNWQDAITGTASSLGSTLGSWLSSGASTAGHYLAKIVPQQWLDTATKIVNSGTKRGQDAYNYIAHLTKDSPKLAGRALSESQDKLISLQRLTTNLLESAIQGNMKLAAKGGVSPAYQRAAAIALLGAESAAAVSGLYYVIGLIDSALKAKTWSTLAVSEVQSDAEKEFAEAITLLSSEYPYELDLIRAGPAELLHHHIFGRFKRWGVKSVEELIKVMAKSIAKGGVRQKR
jgi:hypothetical protein